MKRNGNMMRAYRKIKCHLRSQAGMTLTEMLAAVLILSMTATAIGGGVAVVKEAYKKTTQKAAGPCHYGRTDH
ncbi:MAG: prepilin-type N-terminal cleavage/methylation domain-containing protein [Clostridium sp.]